VASISDLLPRTGTDQKWAVIACDQFASSRIWQKVARIVSGAPTYNLICGSAL
jgi:hypothetical protein